MKYIFSISLTEDVAKALDEVPYGEKSAFVDKVLRAYFDMNPIEARAYSITKKRVKGEEKYPPQEITIDDL